MEKFRETAQEVLRKKSTPGFVIAAGKKGGAKFIEAFGKKQLVPYEIGNDVDTIYDIASVTKVMATTTAIMLLVQRGLINIEMKVSEFIDEFASNGKDKITIKHLLTHTSGLSDWYPYFEEIRRKDEEEGSQLMCKSNAKKMVYSLVNNEEIEKRENPVTKYSDIGFIALGEIIEKITGEALDSFCEREIFIPLGLKDTFFVNLEDKGRTLSEERLKRIAPTEYSQWRGGVIKGEVHDDNAYAMGGISGHAGLFSTAEDVFNFGMTILDSYHGRNDFIKQRVIKEFSKRQLIERDSSWALGWDTPSEGFSTSGHYFSPLSIGHTGYTGTSLWIDMKKEVVIALLSNRVHPDRSNRSFIKDRPLLYDAAMEVLGEAHPLRREKVLQEE
ncbi:MAG: class A beta-lactamase-related serine hydrolase [Candidatus Schekmanbacteria bacterium]|nr:MAG: class A beta-lactamase-related serine hydrolase [Candidatus Schekmanbacteria bacterium]